MKKSPAFILAGFVCLMLIAAGCTSPSGTTPATIPAATTVTPVPSAPAAAATTATASTSAPWSGTWNTSFKSGSQLIGGTLVLIQTGSSVTGIQNNGTFNSTVQGNTITGTWNDRPGFGNETGVFRLVMSEDTNSFTGTWAPASEGVAALENTTRIWNGIRAVIPPMEWSGTWNTGYTPADNEQFNEILTLTQAGSSVTGTYNHGNGTVKAIAQGNRLAGTWSDTSNNETYTGSFDFKQSADTKAFTGRWIYSSEGKRALKNTTQIWSGVRV
ncbi:hypothetical protein [uncultured Methanoregula sp.]|uniref:hypothetical protein n=1 Tax=uncultured Methanoregula sp. TaxID=1005933 RepID=UPI002AABA4E4|nr:hypothetical protein [uncultured Methanoregula sp.]